MSYIVFARKYRPQVFDDITGQSHITTTLKNAIAQDRVAHAYLFSGPRGVGKTTAARILAKALNCEKGPTPTPCNKCATCLEIGQGMSLDVLEIDGASSRGIDDIRNLRDNVKFAPSKGRSKVYIIDEVHMLTAEAFNALLKTLEEPPPHVTFIFATTHAFKVPATILSRCQRFDFRRIGTKDIFANLQSIAKREKVDVKDDALALIARHADGSMRDGQVILDQIVSFADGTIGADAVTSILGVVGEETLFAFSDAVIAKDAPAALGLLDRLIDEGKDVAEIIAGLVEHFRHFSVAKVVKDPGALVDTSPDTVARYQREAAKLSIEEILYIMTTLASTVELVKRSSLSRIPFEAALIKLAQAGALMPLAEIAKRIEQLEAVAKSGRGIASSSAHPGESSGRAAENKSSAQPADNRPSRNDNVVVATPSVIASEPRRGERSNPPSDSEVASSAKPADNRPPRNDPVDSKPAPAVKAEMSPTLMSIAQGWQKVIAHISPRKMSIASYLQEGTIEALDGKALTMSFASEFKFHKEMLEQAENTKLVEAAIKEILGLELSVTFRLAEFGRTNGVVAGDPSDDGYGGEDMPAPDGTAHKDDDPIISSALNMFGGQIAAQTTRKGKPK